MSIITGKGILITYCETEVECPICTFKFDADDKIDEAPYPLFETSCPACKGAIGISVPIYGGNTTCFEWADSFRITTVTPNRINGEVIDPD